MSAKKPFIRDGRDLVTVTIAGIGFAYATWQFPELMRYFAACAAGAHTDDLASRVVPRIAALFSFYVMVRAWMEVGWAGSVSMFGLRRYLFKPVTPERLSGYVRGKLWTAVRLELFMLLGGGVGLWTWSHRCDACESVPMSCSDFVGLVLAGLIAGFSVANNWRKFGEVLPSMKSSRIWD